MENIKGNFSFKKVIHGRPLACIDLFLTLARNFCSLCLICGAIYLAIHRLDGWGWCLFIAYLFHY